MVKKNKDNNNQEEKNTNPAANASSANGEDLGKHVLRDSPVDEEDTTSLDERLLIESFQSITDVFENEENGVENGEEHQVDDENIENERSRSFSEGTDSMDEEVRRIMSNDDTKKKTPNETKSEPKKDTPSSENVSKDASESNDYDDDTEDEEEEAESVLTETESESESDVPFSDSEVEEDNESETSANNWYPPGKDIDDEEAELSEEEEFDLDKYIDKLCMLSTDEESANETDTDSTYSKDTKKAVKKVMKKVKKSCSDEEDSRSESEDDSGDEDTTSNPAVDDDDIPDDADDITEKGSGNESYINDESDDSSNLSSCESDVDFLYDDDDDDDDDSSTDASENEDTESEEREGLDSDLAQVYSDDLVPSSEESGNQPHDAVRKYYMGFDQDKCPVKLDVHENEIGSVALDTTLSSRSVVSLRWPYSNYYVKELDVEQEERDSIFDEGLLPTYKSMQSSASFPGRRRNVMSGRIWWVEWWANNGNLSDVESSERSVEGLQPKYGGDDFHDSEQFDNVSIDNESTHL